MGTDMTRPQEMRQYSQRPASVTALTLAIDNWCNLHGRSMKPDALESWVRLFGHVHERILKVALDKVTKESERMPNPGILSKALTLAYEQFPGYQLGTKICDCRECGGTGFRLVAQAKAEHYEHYRWAVLCDCHPEGHQKFTRRSDDVDYKAGDCPEGRAFLGKLSDIAESTPHPIRNTEPVGVSDILAIGKKIFEAKEVRRKEANRLADSV